MLWRLYVKYKKTSFQLDYAGMALARGNSMGISGLRRAQSLAERRRQPSMAATYGRTNSIANSMTGYVEQQRQVSHTGDEAV